MSDLQQLRQHAAATDDATHIRILEILISALRQQRSSAQDVVRGTSLDDLETLSRELVERSMRHRGAADVGTMEAQIALAEILAKRGQYSVAADLARSALDASQKRLVDCHKLRLDAMFVLALSLDGLGDRHEPAELYVRSIQCLRDKVAANHPVLLSVMCDALPYLECAGRWSEGEAMARQVSENLQTLGSAHASTFAPDLYVARCVSAQGRVDEAESMFQTLLARESAEPADRFERARLHLFYGNHLVRRGEYEHAEDELRNAVELIGDIRIGTWATHRDDVIAAFIALYEAWGRADKAAEYRRLREGLIRPATRPDAL